MFVWQHWNCRHNVGNLDLHRGEGLWKFEKRDGRVGEMEYALIIA